MLIKFILLSLIISEKEELQASKNIGTTPNPSMFKKKVTLNDKKTWTPEMRTRYNMK